MARLLSLCRASLLPLVLLAGAPVRADVDEGYNRAHQLRQDGKDTEAAQEFLQCARSGHCGCMNVLARFYYKGQGLDRDYAMSSYWHVRSFETGTACLMAGSYSAASLGHMLEIGEGLEKDLDQARVWYERAMDLARSYRAEYGDNTDEIRSFIDTLKENIDRTTTN